MKRPGIDVDVTLVDVTVELDTVLELLLLELLELVELLMLVELLLLVGSVVLDWAPAMAGATRQDITPATVRTAFLIICGPSFRLRSHLCAG